MQNKDLIHKLLELNPLAEVEMVIMGPLGHMEGGVTHVTTPLDSSPIGYKIQILSDLFFKE